MKKTAMLITLLFCSLSLSAQGGPQFKDVPLTGIEGTPAYADGNKYQKDALLFVDMLAATHPYYIRAERRLGRVRPLRAAPEGTVFRLWLLCP